MTIQITSPDMEALIEQRMLSGSFKSPEDLIRAMLQSREPELRTGADLIAAMQACPYPEVEIVGLVKEPTKKLRLSGEPFAWIPRKGFSQAKSLFDCGSVYRSAATAVASVLERENSHRSFDAHPLVFLYRHSVECYLKGILCDFGESLTPPVPKESVRKRGHKLDQQIADVKRLSLSAGMELSGTTVNAINRFNAEDRSSTAFRYDGLPPEKQDFDELRFCHEFDSALDDLEALHAVLVSDRIAPITTDV